MIMLWSVGGSIADKCPLPKEKYGSQMNMCVIVTAIVMFGRVEVHINLIYNANVIMLFLCLKFNNLI